MVNSRRQALVQTREFNRDVFLNESWQKKPALIKALWDPWRNPLDPDELAGLACEAEVEARLVTQARGTYAVEHGPFDADRFADLHQEPWTLLVQGVDHHVPNVSALLNFFRFVPNWRIDDVMVSYAVDQGGVGPHYDQYDVFLVQGMGKRLWQIGARCNEQSELLPHHDLRLLAQFEPVQEWLLEPGDVLYVPPGIAHNGVAVGDDCMTYSIGFRAPSRADLVSHWADHVVEQLNDDDRYTDPDLMVQANPGEITAETLARLQAMLSEKLLDGHAFARWFGSYNTMAKNPSVDWSPESTIDTIDLRALPAPVTLERNPACRFAFVRESDDGVTLFVDGEAYACSGTSARFAERICAVDCTTIDAADITSQEMVALIVQLLNLGSIAIAEED